MSTSQKDASLASEILRNPKSSKAEKSVAGSRNSNTPNTAEGLRISSVAPKHIQERIAMLMPNTKSSINDPENNVMYHIMAYRELDYAEMVQCVRM